MSVAAGVKKVDVGLDSRSRKHRAPAILVWRMAARAEITCMQGCRCLVLVRASTTKITQTLSCIPVF